jgi:type I restriction enzyme S subunit
MATENKTTSLRGTKQSVSLIPKLRFKEFEDQWEKKKLGSLCEMTSSKRVYLSDYVSDGIPFYRGKEISELRLGKIPSDVLYISRERYEEFKEKYGIPEKGDILITAVGTLGNVLRIKNNDEFYFKDGNLIWLKNIKDNIEFIEILIQWKKNDLIKTSIGSTQKALTMVELRKLIFSFPSLKEQQKIASFLTSVDTKIQQLTTKKQLLENYKKGVMQKLFSQQLRFKPEATNTNVIARTKDEAISNSKNAQTSFPDWEEKKLGEVCDVRDGTHDSPKYKKVGLPLITSKNLMKDGSIDFENVNFISKIDFDNINKRSGVDNGDILFGMIGTIGNPVIVNESGFAIKNVALIKEKVLIKNTFLIQYLKSSLIQKQFYEQNTGGTQKFIALGVIRNLLILTPSLKEQQKIANYLSAIDTKISTIQTQIEKTQAFKKGLLQQMFV